jgi:formylglycine-generating enzyme required for sulfatase activity
MLRKSGRLCPKQIVHLGLQIAEGLKAAHERGMIHRDIKPGNLWFEPVKGGRIKILDFGLARSLASNVQLTQSGAVLGTPAYMAPEQASAKPVDHRCDLFSLGCVLYQMATGERPFVGEDTMSVLMALARYDPTPPRQLNTEIPPALSDLIMHLLEKDPNKRISSAAEVIKALTKLQKQHAVQPEALSVPKPPEVPKQRERKLPDVSEPETKTLPLATKKARDRSPRAVLLGIGVAFALLACVLGGTLLFFGTTIIRIATNKGELVVEADGDDVEITVKQGGVVIVDRKKERSFVLTAQGGEVEFFDPSSGVRLLTKEFKLDRGGKTVVRVREELALARIPVEKEDKKKDPPPKDVPAKEEKKMADEKKETKKDDKITKPPDKEIKVVIERPPAKTITNSLGMALVYIPPGKFLMGSPKSEGGSASEKPQHEVEITRGFYLGKYEVTQGEYEAVMRTNPSYFSAGGGGKQTVQGKDTSRFPVDTVSWQDAKDFCRKLTERERKEGKLPPNEECGLPTEAEWEYACRGGTKKQQAYHYGATLSPKEANINIVGAQQLGRTEKVGSYEPNGFGLYDMHGNVWEWCEDRYNEKEYQRGKCKDPSGPLGGSSRVVRGGGWFNVARGCRSAHRYAYSPDDRRYDLGFRVTRRSVEK